MMVVVVYDISGADAAASKRLRNVVRTCGKYGVRVQKSVFECLINAEQYRQIRQALSKTINGETDSIRFYLLGKHYQTRIETLGRGGVSWDRETFVL